MLLTILLVLGALATLAFGIWLGSAPPYRPDMDDIEEAIDQERPRRQATRHFTFLNAYSSRKAPPKARDRRRGRTPFS